MNEVPTENLYDKIFVARQPIFTQDMQIWGYELLFRHGENMQVAVITDSDQATTQVIADGFTLASQGMRRGAKALINFPRNVLIGAAPLYCQRNDAWWKFLKLCSLSRKSCRRAVG